MSDALAPKRRLASLDQFRGYTVAGMFLVNFVGGYVNIPAILKHHSVYCSYADTIMPQFFFAVGFAFRLSFGRRVSESGAIPAYRHAVLRMLGLILVGLVLYTLDVPFRRWSTLENAGFWGAIKHPLKHEWFQTLVHIAITSLWILPVIAAGPAVRIFYLIASSLLHLWLTWWFNFEWVYTEPGAIDGGPLGFLTWSIPTLVGTLACDAMRHASLGTAIAKLSFWGIILAVFGYAMSCLSTLYNVPVAVSQEKGYRSLADSPVIVPLEKARSRDFESLLAEPPFVPPPPAIPRPLPDGSQPTVLRQLNYWMMSQKVGTLSYLYFSAGFSLLVYVLFVLLADVWSIRIGVFRTLGVNALAGYILHGMVSDAVSKFTPGDSPRWYVWTMFGVFFAICYLFLRHLEKEKIYLKL